MVVAALDELDMAERTPSEQSIFLTAVEKPTAAERGAYLDQACTGNADLRSEVEALLAAHERLPVPGTSAAADLDPLPAFTAPGTVIGRYKILEPIGEGGYGTVFMAEQTAPVQRRVALKIIKAGMDTRQVIARFEAERQALALMDHPNIAKVFDAGVTDTGRPYFVMELVKGTPITRYCDDHRLPPRQRLELFVQVCQAVQHAHQKGIIHRDLKPTNVLVAQYDAKPVPKVIDFGVAKATGQQLTERTMFTGFGDVIGTPQYMSPEQAELNQLDIDTRSDIYSLGVLLYELLTGTTPLEAKRVKEAALLEVLRVIREEEPPKPSTRLSTSEQLSSIAANRGLEPKKLNGFVHGELDWIVMKALEKDRTRRYETANGLAHDLERYLADEPVLACPPSTVYRLKKFARRNKATLLTASVIGIALLIAVGSFGWIVRDRSARHAKVAGQVELILTEVEQLEREQKWPEALVAARRASAVVTSGEADTATARRVRERLKDLEFLDRLEQICMLQATWVGRTFDNAATDRAYREAFRDYGLDVDELAVEKSIDRLKAGPTIAIPLAAALDHWASVRRHQEPDAGWERLTAIARSIDPDPLRDRLRATRGKTVFEIRDEMFRLAESIDIRAHHPTTLNQLALRLVEAEHSESGLRVLRKAQSAYPGDFWLNFSLGRALADQKDYEGAIRFYTAAVSIRPHATAALNNLGNALTDQGKVDDAIAAFRKAIEIDPKFTFGYVNLGSALGRQGKLEDAIVASRKAIEIDSKSARAYSNLGNALRKQRKLDEAIAALHKAIELDPASASAYYNLGSVLAEQRKVGEAVAAYRKAIELDPNVAAYHVSLGARLCDDLKEYDKAIECFRKAIELDPKNAWAYNNLGVALRGQKNLDEAIVNFRKAIELDPRHPYAHGSLANALERRGKFEEAIAAYEKAVAIDPKSTWPLNAFAWLLATCRDAKFRDPARAATLAKEAVELAPRNPNYLNTLGIAEYRAGNWQAAVEALTKSVSLRDAGVEASDWFFLAMAHWRLGNKDEARRWYEIAVNWMDASPSRSTETMKRVRSEAAALLGMKEPK
jgi:tetratricopeptide (TPR) repeat protein/serine/threonine protein kinase